MILVNLIPNCELVVCKGCGLQRVRGTKCRPCWTEYMRGWNKLNAETVRQSKRRKWRRIREKDLIRRKKDFRKNKYGLSYDDYLAMALAQENVCAICRGSDAARGRSLCVDHDHQTGKLRELLCMKCNGLLGFVNDSIELLETAIAYLNKHKELHARRENL